MGNEISGFVLLSEKTGICNASWNSRYVDHRESGLSYLEKWSVPGYLAVFSLGIAVMLIGEEYNGSKRWLSLGPFSFQPSEFAKVAVILFLTYDYAKCKKHVEIYNGL